MTPAEVRDRYIENFPTGGLGIFLEGISIRIDMCNRRVPFSVATSLIVADVMKAKDRRIAELEAEKAERDKPLPEGARWFIMGPPVEEKPFVLEED